MAGSLSRREFLERLSLAACAGVLACSETLDPVLPEPDKSGLEHIVVVIMENRSFDHLLGWVPGADGQQAGLRYPDASGIFHPTFHLADFQGCSFSDPSHSFEGGRQEYHAGACDGWLVANGNDQYAIGYYLPADLPFLGRAATQWTVLERYFTPFMGPTYPNRLIAQAGATDRLSNTTAASTLPAIWDRLGPRGVSGANYGYGFVTASIFGTRYQPWIRSISAFFDDASSGNLPNVAYVDPDFWNSFTNSYHPPDDIRTAEAFLADIYRAVTTGPAWSSTLLVITFDEWGGFYDHVPPPVAPVPEVERQAGNLDGLRGFRVPTLLISPFARRGAVSSMMFDHASILRLIEWRWQLDPLTGRDANANNLAAALDFASSNASAPAIDVAAGPFGAPCR